MPIHHGRGVIAALLAVASSATVALTLAISDLRLATDPAGAVCPK